MYSMDECVCVSVYLSVQVISLDVSSNLCLPLVSIVEELLFVVEQFFMGLGGKLKVRTLTKREGE